MTPRELANQTSDNFPSRLKGLRKSADLSQEQLADAADCSVITLSKFETGANRPSFEILISLAIALGISLDELVGRSSSAKKKVSPRKAEALARLDKAVSDLSIEWVNTLTDIAKKAK